jgi:hypothetical protein
MLATSAATQVMRSFHDQLYELKHLLGISKGDDVEPYNEAMNQEALDASHAFFDSIFQREEGLRAILASTRGYAGPELAPLYGLQVDEGLEVVDLGPARTGYFMQAPFLMLHGYDLTPDPIHRGTALLLDVLCASVPPPPNNHIVDPADPDPDQTNRESVSAQTSTCGTGCHDVYIDPLGFAFEGFDGMGQERELDNGQPIDASGTHPFSTGELAFSDARELMQILADSPEAHLCYSKMVAGYGLGRDIVEHDTPLLEDLAAASHQGSLAEVVLSLVRHPAFRVRQEGNP